jgi:hypothetical protein
MLCGLHLSTQFNLGLTVSTSYPICYSVIILRFDAGYSQHLPVAYPGMFFGGGSTNSPEDRGKKEGGSGGSSPLVRGFTQFAIEQNPDSD